MNSRGENLVILNTIGNVSMIKNYANCTNVNSCQNTEPAIHGKPELTCHQGHVSTQDRQQLLRLRPITVWLTGLSGSGKSTLAFALEQRLVELGYACYALDGDNVRHGLNRDLGFSPEDRAENIRRVAEVARLLNDAGLIVVTSFISPYCADREIARQIIGAESFREVYLCTSLAACEQRDTKGLYRKARAGELSDFTGISAPYQAPEHPCLAIDTELTGIEASLKVIMDKAVSDVLML